MIKDILKVLVKIRMINFAVCIFITAFVILINYFLFKGLNICESMTSLHSPSPSPGSSLNRRWQRSQLTRLSNYQHSKLKSEHFDEVIYIIFRQFWNLQVIFQNILVFQNHMSTVSRKTFLIKSILKKPCFVLFVVVLPSKFVAKLRFFTSDIKNSLSPSTE